MASEDPELEETAVERRSEKIVIETADSCVLANQFHLSLSNAKNMSVCGLMVQNNYYRRHSGGSVENDGEAAGQWNDGQANRQWNGIGPVPGPSPDLDQGSGSEPSTPERPGSRRTDKDEKQRILSGLVSFYEKWDSSWSPTPWDAGTGPSWDDVHVETKLVGAPDGSVRELAEMLVGYRRVLLYGPPGSGLSTACGRLARNWSLGRTVFRGFPVRDTVVLALRMRLLTPKVTLEEALLRLMLQRRGGYLDDDSDFRTCVEILKKSGRRTVVLLDGYEEAPDGHRAQIARLAGSGSLFARASVVVTCASPRPEEVVDRDTLALFQVRYAVLCPSEESCRLLVRGHGARDHVCLLPPRPLLLCLMCHAGCARSAEGGAEEAYGGLALLVARRRSPHLGDDEVRTKMDRLGEYFWPHVAHRRRVFSEKELREGLGGDFQFASASGLIAKVGRGVWETSHPVLTDAAVARHLRGAFARCSDLDHLLPRRRISRLRVAFHPLREGRRRFRLYFDVEQFRFSCEADGGEVRCSVRLASLLDPEEEPRFDLRYSFAVPLASAEPAAVFLSLGQLFPECREAVDCVRTLVRGGAFLEMSLELYALLDSECELLEPQDPRSRDVLSLSDPLWSLGDASLRFGVVLSGRACTDRTWRTVLGRLGLPSGRPDATPDPLKQALKLQSHSRFALALLDCEFALARVTPEDHWISDKTEIVPWSLFQQELCWQECNRVELHFGGLPADAIPEE